MPWCNGYNKLSWYYTTIPEKNYKWTTIHNQQPTPQRIIVEYQPLHTRIRSCPCACSCCNQPSQPMMAVPSQPMMALPSQPMMAVPSQPMMALPSQPMMAVPSQPMMAVPSQPMMALPSQLEATIPRPVQSQPSVLKEDCGCSLD